MSKPAKAVQYFSDEHLQRSLAMSVTERLRFLDQYRQLHSARQTGSKSRLISLKVPEDLLEQFKQQCRIDGVKYQTQIKQLMMESISKDQALRARNKKLTP